MRRIAMLAIVALMGCKQAPPETMWQRDDSLRDARIEAKLDAIVEPVVIDCTGYKDHDKQALKDGIAEALKGKYHFIEFGGTACACRPDFSGLDKLPPTATVHIFGGYFTDDEKRAQQINQTGLLR